MTFVELELQRLGFCQLSQSDTVERMIQKIVRKSTRIGCKMQGDDEVVAAVMHSTVTY